MDVSHMT